MLRELTIRNFAIIDDLHISFSDGLTVLTGETGAGKSIIINAVNLLLGGRVSSGLVRSGAETAEIEALFNISSDGVTARLMAEYGLVFSEELLIRRIISQHDKHKAFINGRLVTGQMLSAVTENLASISGQHAHQGLLKEESHLLFLDRYGGLSSLRESVASCYREMLPLIDKLLHLQKVHDHRQEQLSLLEFQNKEIEQVAPIAGEDHLLEKELVRLKHAEMLYQTVQNSIEMLYGAQGSVVEQFSVVNKELIRAAQVDPDLTSSVDALTELSYQVQDLVEKLRSYTKGIQTDEGRREEIEDRLNVLNKLKRKYGGTIETVLSRKAHIVAELNGVENIADGIRETQTQLEKLHVQLIISATALSEKRVLTATTFSKKVENELADLKMAGTSFQVNVHPVPAGKQTNPHFTMGDLLIDETGLDRVSFMIAPNMGETLKPLSKIASGGELSRVVLALMSILAETESVGLIIFDEVDTGIGGSVAEMVGKKMVKLSHFHQVICITHLPQIAKFGDHHYRISKSISHGRTRTTILPLSSEERVGEIARMLGGVSVTQTTLAHARELLDNGI